jgi:hypothetical protein
MLTSLSTLRHSEGLNPYARAREELHNPWVWGKGRLWRTACNQPEWRGRKRARLKGVPQNSIAPAEGRRYIKSRVIPDWSRRNDGGNDEPKPGSDGEPQKEVLRMHTMPVHCARWRRILRTGVSRRCKRRCENRVSMRSRGLSTRHLTVCDRNVDLQGL